MVMLLGLAATSEEHFTESMEDMWLQVSVKINKRTLTSSIT